MFRLAVNCTIDHDDASLQAVDIPSRTQAA